MTDAYLDGLPDYLSDEDILCLGGDPEELLLAGVEPYRGHAGVRCWARQDVLDWLGGTACGEPDDPFDLPDGPEDERSGDDDAR